MDNIIKNKDYRKKILLIEDNPNDIRSIQEMFKNFDNKSFEMILKTNLSESIESIKENVYSIILINPLLSGYQEFDALETIMKENLKIPIIVLIEKDYQALAIKAVKYITQDYLDKRKMNSSLLEKSILYIIERSKLKNDLEELTKYLKFSEDRYKALIDNVPFPVFILNTECKIVNINEKAIDLFEFSKEELLDLNIFDLIDNKSIDAGKEYFFKTIYDLKNSNIIETVVNTKTHKTLYIEIISTILRIEDTKFIISFFSNITERIMHEKNKEKFFDKLQKSSETKKGLYVSLSHEFRTPLNAIMGFSQLLIEEYYGELNESQKDFVNDILSSGDYLMNILELISEDISDIIYNRDKDNKFNNLNKYVSNTSNNIKISEINNKELFDDNLSGIILIDSSGFFLDCSEFVLNLFKVKKVDVIGKNIKEIAAFFKDSYIIILELFNKFLKGENSKPINIKLQRENGSNIRVKLSFQVIHLKNKECFQLIVRNITEQKQIELLSQDFNQMLEKEVVKRTKELQDALEQQKKYLDQIIKSSQFKTEFMATMSHELRTPLNAIIGFTELLLEGGYGQLNKDQINFLQDIKSSAEHQFDMIYQILDISKIESGQMILNLTSFLLNDLINQIVSTVKPLYTQKGLKFKIIGLDSPKNIVADSVRLKEIIYNLLTNAIKFTIEGEIKLIMKDDKENWTFIIQDTGIGIDKKDYDLIFKDFKRINSPYVNSVPGTGLGLALTRRLVQLHNGKIWFESELGKGSTFFFTIPKIST